MYVLRKRRYKREVVGGGDSPMRDLLSPREKQLLKRLAAGKTDAQIAERLGGTAKQV
ncbi:LuxR C-terminal-related transcriptional regulator [Bradyrhizobium sp. McL0616]|uniref:LuxR C-terminal-related transcriptional regulator n=1 Tax=Bradyrhizobium sp. McL0616 TaxID=3415674 RepID=UPI003CFB2C3F